MFCLACGFRIILEVNIHSLCGEQKAMETRNKFIVIGSLLWIVLVRSFDPALLSFFPYWNSTLYHNIVNSLTVVFYIILPVFGLLIDNKFGLLNTTSACTFIGVLSSLSHAIALVINSSTSTATDTVSRVVLPLNLFTRLYFEISVFCFATEQLIEMSSSSNQLSSFVWWFVWCRRIGATITAVSSCLTYNNHYYEIYLSSTHLSFLSMILISTLFIKRWAFRYIYSENPFKITSSVLCFALKNKYPSNRSALTHWEEVKPSRINLGKAKYGGPFSEKDVDSVKVFIHLLLLTVMVTMIFFPYQTLARLLTDKQSFKECLLYGTYFIEYAVVIVVVPVYQLIIKPYCLVPIKVSMLQRTGIGIALTVLGKLGYVILDLSVSVSIYINHNEAICLLQSTLNGTNSHDLIKSSSLLYYYMIPSCINSFGVLLITVGSFEFVFAQAPHSMRGLLIRLWFSIGGIYEIAGWMMIKPFKAVSEYLVPSCELYILIMNFLFMLVSLILFILFSKRYKLNSNEELHDETQFNSCDQSKRYGSMGVLN